MAISLQDLVDTACLLARADGVKRDAVAQLLVPRVLTWVGQRAARDPDRRGLVTTTFTLGLVNGAVALPASVLTEFMKFATVADPTDPTMAKKMRWTPDWRELVRPLDSTLGYFTVTGGGLIFRMTQPGVAYSPGAGMTGNIDLSTPAKPVLVGTILSAPGEIEQEVVVALTAALKGDWQAITTAEVPK